MLRDGSSWATCPEEELPPIPDWSDIDDTENYRAVTGEFLWPSNYEADPRRTASTIAPRRSSTAGVFGNKEKPEVPEFEIEARRGTARCRWCSTRRTPGHLGVINPSKTRTCRSARRSRCRRPGGCPNLLLLDVGTPMGQLKIFDVNIPIDEETTLVKFVALRTFFKGKWADRDARRRVFKVLYEDHGRRRHGASGAAALRPVRRAAREERLQRRALPPAPPRAHRDGLDRVEGNTIVGEGPARVEQRVIPSPIRKEVPELASAWNFKEVRSKEILRGNTERVARGDVPRTDSADRDQKSTIEEIKA